MPKTKTKTKQDTPDLSARVKGRVLPPSLDLSGPIEEANEAAIASGVEMTLAECEQADTGKAVKNAARADLAAAAERGDDSIELTARVKEETHERAKVRARVAEAKMKESAKNLRTAIRENPEYLHNLDARHGEARRAVNDSLLELVSAWAEMAETQAARGPARRIVEESWSGPVIDSYRDEAAISARVEKLLNRRRQIGDRDLPELEQLLADLTYRLELGE